MSTINFTRLSLVCFLAFSGVSNNGFAQQADSLKSESIIIVRDFEPIIKTDVRKLDINPVIQEVKLPPPNFKYTTVPFADTVSFVPERINPAKLKGEPLDKLYRAYVTAGVGNFLNHTLQAKVSSIRDRKQRWGLNVEHFGSDGGITDVPYNGFSSQLADGFYKRIFRAHILSASAGYTRDRVYRYGFESNNVGFDPELIEREDIAQTYNQGYGAVSIQSFFADSSDINYKLDLKFHHVTNEDGGTRETGALFSSRFDRFFDAHQGIVSFDADYNAPSSSSAFYDSLGNYQSNMILRLGLDVVLNISKFRINAGLKMALESQNDNQMYLYPNIELSYRALRKVIIPYAGIRGDLRRRSFNTTRLENPFIEDFVELRNENTVYNAFVGVRGAYSSTISYDVRASRQRIENFGLFTNIYGVQPNGYNILVLPISNTFQVIYDDLNLICLTGELTFHQVKQWDITFMAEYFSYDFDNTPEAWHLPDFKTSLKGKYNLNDLFYFTGSVNFWSTRYAKTLNQEDPQLAFNEYGRQLDAVIDLNLGAEYIYSKRASIYLNINNITAQNYQLWNRYPVQGINVLLGFTYGFWSR
jgi:hypothetical protein